MSKKVKYIQSTFDVKYSGDNFVSKFSKKVKLTVKKTNPKISDSTNTFSHGIKTKKYTVTLKDNKPIKKAKISLNVNGKTYTAKTTSKGKATFKITNLAKKGTYNAVVKYGGSKYYNKLNKNMKITVK